MAKPKPTTREMGGATRGGGPRPRGRPEWKHHPPLINGGVCLPALADLGQRHGAPPPNHPPPDLRRIRAEHWPCSYVCCMLLGTKVDIRWIVDYLS